VSTGSETLKVPALTRQPVAHLPALKRSVHLGVDAGRPLVGQIKLASDWELNEKAPSWMALFEKRSGDQGEPHRGDAPSVGKAVASFVQIQEFPVQLGPPSVASACGGEAVICSASELTTLSFPMMPLAEGKQYLLQGTIYMCKRGNHATCSLMSYQCELDPRKSFELAEGQATFQIE
jgi:hypothetical protein